MPTSDSLPAAGGSVPEPLIRVGPAGWSYTDWKGIVYPAKRSAGFHEAAYLASFFDVLEINTSFYRPVAAAMASRWVRHVAHNPRFRFTAKLHQSFTHTGNWNQRTALVGGRPALRAGSGTDADERGFCEMADVLAAEDRLGAVLIQFPWSFRHTNENRAYLEALLGRFREYPLVVEVRHSSWNEPGFFDLLRQHRAGFCNLDQPVIGKSLAPTTEVTSPVAYIRLHGRNYREWFRESGRDARYNYLYSKSELEAWKPRVEQVAGRAEATYVITNNHYQGQAVANALQLVSLLRNAPVNAPPSLVAAYPQLKDCTTTEQGFLFEDSAALKAAKPAGKSGRGRL